MEDVGSVKRTRKVDENEEHNWARSLLEQNPLFREWGAFTLQALYVPVIPLSPCFEILLPWSPTMGDILWEAVIDPHVPTVHGALVDVGLLVSEAYVTECIQVHRNGRLQIRFDRTCPHLNERVHRWMRPTTKDIYGDCILHWADPPVRPEERLGVLEGDWMRYATAREWEILNTPERDDWLHRNAATFLPRRPLFFADVQ